MKLRALIPFVLALLMVAPFAAAAAVPSLDQATRPARSYVIGFDGEFPDSFVKAAGARVVGVDKNLGFAVVESTVGAVLEIAVSGHPDITYVEPNGLVRAASATWDAATWDAATWDAAQWDAAQWDAAQWDAASWDAASWDAATWDAAQWDAAQWDAAQWDAAQWDAAQWDAATWDAAQWDAAQWDGTPAADPAFEVQWGLGAMHVPEAWETTTAFHRTTICVVDSGIDPQHSDLARNVKRLSGGSFGYDFVNNDADPTDDGGHGTHVAGIAAAVLGNGHGIAGVSQAYVVAAKVLDSTGTGTDANLARGIAFCADAGAPVILLALHADGPSRAVEDAVKYAQGKGLLLVAASGNAGLACRECVAFPASMKGVLAVGASAPDGSVPDFSNRGSKLSLVAPGVRIPGLFADDRYAIGTGTSQAAANAAGAAALVLAAHPGFTAKETYEALTKTAKDDGTAGFDETYGYGHLRADLAVAYGGGGE